MKKKDWGASTLLQNTPILMGDNTIPGLSIPKEIEEILPAAFDAVDDFGLDYYETIIEWMTYDGISEVAAYDGFPQRYPHWRFGMAYEELSKGYEFGQRRIFEMVINNRPCVIYFLNSNSYTDNVTVLLHALFHNDFFKNNVYFKPTNTKMMNEFGNNRARIMNIMDRWGEDKVEAFIDDCLAIDTLVDPSSAWNRREYQDPIRLDEREYQFPRRLNVPEGHDYMENWINPKEWVSEEWQRIKKEEFKKSLGIVEMFDRDIMAFLRDNAPLNPWEQNVLSMIYDEAMYFTPQGMTQVANEGWACLTIDGLLQTTKGFLRIGDIVECKTSVVVDGGLVTNWFKHEEHECIKITTRRGLEVEGSVTHRLLLSNGEWRRLDEMELGDIVKLSYGSDVWAENVMELDWQPKRRLMLEDVATQTECSLDVVKRYRKGFKVRKKYAKCLQTLIPLYESDLSCVGRTADANRNKIKVPCVVDESLASFLGYLTGDGHVSDIKRTIGLTSGDEEQVNKFIGLVDELFGLKCHKRWDSSSLNGRWRVSFSSEDVKDFLIHLGIPTGMSARVKKIPDCILRSPKMVMSAFLRAYFDCDGGAYDTGIVLSTSSVEMAKMIQVVLLNYGILTRKYLKDHDNWHINITGKSAGVFMDQIGFDLKRKQDALNSYVNERKWFLEEAMVDEVVSIEKTGKHTVYDITVEGTHRYSAQGFVNHNSFGDFWMMARLGFPKCSIFEYSKHKAAVLGGVNSMNPYKLGFELFMDIEDRWNKGRFGREYDKCLDNQQKENWDLKLGLGHQKVLEVRENYNDVTMIAEFFTEAFCQKHNFYNWGKFGSSEPGVEAEYRVTDKDWKKVRQNLIKRRLNRGLPEIRLVDPNGKGMGILVIQHVWDGRILQPKYSNEALRSLTRLWRKPVALLTKDKDEKDQILYCSNDLNTVKELGRGEWLTM
jgi:stage V sporulation protein R